MRTEAGTSLVCLTKMKNFVSLIVLIFVISWSLSVSGIAPGDDHTYCTTGPHEKNHSENHRILLDSYNYFNLITGFHPQPVWRKNSGTAQGWTEIAGDGICHHHVRVCDYMSGQGSSQNNWIFTQYIEFLGAKEVFVNITFNFGECRASSACTRPYAKLYVHATNVLGINEQSMTSRYELLSHLEQPYLSDQEDQMLSVSFEQQNIRMRGFYLGFHDMGTCGTIKHVQVYYRICPSNVVGLTSYPELSLPLERSTIPAVAQAFCPLNSVEHTAPGYKAYGNGSCEYGAMCKCKPGYKDVSTVYGYVGCQACPMGTYRSESDISCQSCPSNTVPSGIAVSECPCMSGYYRTEEEGPETGCTSPPTPCRNIHVIHSETTDTVLSVKWYRPRITGRDDFYYNIHYSSSDSGEALLQYNREPYLNNEGEASYSINGLDPYTNYTIRVTVHNGVSDQDQNLRKCETSATTRPGPPMLVRSYCEVVLWDIPPYLIGHVTGYNLNFFVPGTQLSMVVNKGSDDIHHLVQESNTFNGSDNTYYQVRAFTQSVQGVWTQGFKLCSCATSVPIPGPLQNGEIHVQTCQAVYTCDEGYGLTHVGTYQPDGKLKGCKPTCNSELVEDTMFDNSASEFFVGFTVNTYPRRLRRGDPILSVTTVECSPVQFTVSTTGYTFSGITANNLTSLVTLPPSFLVASNDTTERNKGVYVKGEKGYKIVVNGINHRYFSDDTFLALPCTDLGLVVDEYEYYGISYGNPARNRYYGDPLSEILIVACEDNTTVTSPLNSLTLNRLETYSINGTDMSGVRVTTTKPVSFFSNHQCAEIPSKWTWRCNHLTEQLPPTITWGRFFLAASLLGRSSGEIFRMVAAHNSTTVTVNCTTFPEPEIYSMDAGNWTEFNIIHDPPSFCSIESSLPILVVQFALSYEANNRSYGSDDDYYLGSPFMMMIVPTTHYTNDYVINAFSFIEQNYITLYVTPEYYQPEKIFVDDANQMSSEWTPVYSSEDEVCGYIARVSLEQGVHKIHHEDSHASLGVSSYGFDWQTSYGHPGGFKWKGDSV